MIFVVSKSIIKEGKAAEYKQQTVRLIEETRKEAGCISYDLCEDIDNPNILTFIEKWEDKQHLDLHMKTAHFMEIVPKLKDLRVSSELSIYKEV
ncbi:MAG: antibiotic biosynthesis monooxygenase [Clostridia bacterium]|jgi:quinol monooxygenase YgiN|nr:antibiotic biosynthesis monooxygenase [Clostridia bacterium]MDF2892718.1 antibiotic biosynthesis monooxygenase [Clostridia bacterium]